MKMPCEYMKYLDTPSDCPIYDENKPDYRCSVDYDRTNYRKNKAVKEHTKQKVEFDDICNLLNDFLKKIGANYECISMRNIDVLKVLNYKKIQRNYDLKKPSDIVWLKFTNDGYLGVVASSNDVNYDENTNSYKLINHVGCKWDSNSVIIVPIAGINNVQEREMFEKVIGNYLIDKGVPIIDYYSHMGFKR